MASIIDQKSSEKRNAGKYKCETHFNIFEGYPEELQTIVRNCQDILLSSENGNPAHSASIYHKGQRPPRDETRDDSLLTNLLHNKKPSELLENTRVQEKKLKTNEIIRPNMISKPNIIETKLVSGNRVKFNQQIKEIPVDISVNKPSFLNMNPMLHKNTTLINKKCYNLRFTENYKECINRNYKCHSIVNDKEKLKECRLINGIYV